MNWKHYKPNFEFKQQGRAEIFSAWGGHECFVYDLVRNYRPEKIVELGSHFGFSFFSMCQAAKDAKLKSTLVAVDTWEGDKHAGFHDESVFNKVKELQKKYYSNLQIILSKKTFDDASKDFENNSIDILHIDGLHTYSAVKKDFKTWLPKVKEDGIILFHDVSEKSSGFGVYRLWDELKIKYSSMEFCYSHGLGVLFMEKNALKPLISMYNEIVGQCTDRIIDESGEIIKASEQAFEQFNKDIEKARTSSGEKDKWIKHLEEHIRFLNQEVESLREQKSVTLKKLFFKKMKREK